MAAISNVPAQRVIGMASAAGIRMVEDFRRWLQEVKDAIDRSAQRVGESVALTAQASSVSGTVSTPTLAAGVYRVSWLLRVTQAATTSSGLQISIGATADAVLTTQDGPALTNGAAGAVQSGSVLVAVDAGTTITYAVAYASVGATPLRYTVSVTVEGMTV